MKVRDLIESLQKCDPDAQVGVRCASCDDVWIHTEIGIDVCGIGGMAEVAITNSGSGFTSFSAPFGIQ